MEQPVVTKPLGLAQSSIRSFFQPRQPSYAAPPASPTSRTKNDDKQYSEPSSLKASTPTNSTAIAEPKSSPRAATSTLPPQGSISTISTQHIQPLKRINALLLPINYPDSFYHKILDPDTSPNFSRVVLWQDAPSSKSDFSSSTDPKVVGGIVCRLDTDNESKSSSIYIQSLALLSPYRSHGLATAVLEDIIKGLVSTPHTGFPITSLYAHVWTENTEGLNWYSARGFTREDPVVQGYYRRLQPGNAWIMRRSLVPSDHLRHAHPTNNQRRVSPPQAPPNESPTPSLPRASSYQNTGPGHEWNDLPEDILSNNKPSPQPLDASLLPPSLGNSHLLKPSSATGSAASSRSSSSTRTGGKKKRVYPVAAFGGAGSS